MGRPGLEREFENQQPVDVRGHTGQALDAAPLQWVLGEAGGGGRSSIRCVGNVMFRNQEKKSLQKPRDK